MLTRTSLSDTNSVDLEVLRGKAVRLQYPVEKIAEYLPAESNTGCLGQLQLARTDLDACQWPDLRALYQFYQFYGDDFKSNAPPVREL
jgi:hypothetical protein